MSSGSTLRMMGSSAGAPAIINVRLAFSRAADRDSGPGFLSWISQKGSLVSRPAWGSLSDIWVARSLALRSRSDAWNRPPRCKGNIGVADAGMRTMLSATDESQGPGQNVSGVWSVGWSVWRAEIASYALSSLAGDVERRVLARICAGASVAGVVRLGVRG